VLVENFPEIRSIEGNRAYFNQVSHGDQVFNTTLIVMEFLGTRRGGRLRQAAMLVHRGLRGTRKAPGLLLLALGLVTGYPNTWERFKGYVQG